MLFLFKGWIWRCGSYYGFWKNPGMFLCDIWRAGYCTAHTNHREQFQQVLCQTEKVGECSNTGSKQEISEPFNLTEGQRG